MLLQPFLEREGAYVVHTSINNLFLIRSPESISSFFYFIVFTIIIVACNQLPFIYVLVKVVFFHFQIIVRIYSYSFIDIIFCNYYKLSNITLD